MTFDLLLIAGGLIGLLFGGEALVRGAVSLAQKLGISPLVISLTVLGFGTSMPELLVSLRAALSGAPDIALGNVVGSNTANILLILGLCMAIAPIQKYDPSVKRDMTIATFAALLLFILVQFETIGRLSGALLFVGLIVFLAASYLMNKGTDAPDDDAVAPLTSFMTGLWLWGGFVLLFGGAEALVRGSVSIARNFGISEAVIGLTIVAIGTSLPELATSMVAALRKKGDLALGNVIGSNIFNILGILGVTALITPVGVGANFPNFDVPVMLAASVVLLGLLVLKLPLGRIAGLGFLAAYGVYLYSLSF